MTAADTDIAELVRSRLRDVADFPQPGILFKDMSPLLADGAAFATVVKAMARFADGIDGQAGADLVAGVEARGFVLAGALALALGCGQVMVRKAGKLPPPTIRREYALEYGTAEVELPVDSVRGRRVLLVDDVLATGGTLRAAAGLIADAGGTVTALGVLLELGFLDGRSVLSSTAPVHSLLTL